jgi:hypothetical protein
LIRRAARLANSLDIVRELLETAFHIDDMAARVEKRCGSGESYTGPPRSHVSSVARQILQSPTSRSLAFPAADCRFRPPES